MDCSQAMATSNIPDPDSPTICGRGHQLQIMEMTGDFRDGDITVKELFQLSWTSETLMEPVALCTLRDFLRAVGLRNGHAATITERTAKSASMFLALEDDLRRISVYCPEGWAEPERFYRALDRLGTLKDELIITL
ncbi:hypothetical protein HFD88_000903 [Aspergillus terreus]|nr:hypothetical protein HFD88_000903 [Aspergillus terreus]